jgi:hypothetical protein
MLLFKNNRPSARLIEHGRGHVMPLSDPGVVEAMAQLILEPPPQYVVVDHGGEEEEEGHYPALDDADTSPASSQRTLEGVTLKSILTMLVETYGWETLGQKLPINCFLKDPSIKSSLNFLRKHEWARKKIEALYLDPGAAPDKVLASSSSSSSSSSVPDSGSDDE